jgi:hypothetical protein
MVPLKDLNSPPQYIDEDDDDEEDDYEEEHDEDPSKKQGKKRKPRVISCYTLFEVYSTHEQAQAVIEKDDCMKYERARESTDGKKSVYRCKYSPACKFKCYTLITEDGEASVWYNDQDHANHDAAKLGSCGAGGERENWGMNKITKAEIAKMYAQKEKYSLYPSQVLNSLRQMSQEFLMVSGILSTQKNPKYVAGVVVPTKMQIKNFLNNTLKPKKAAQAANASQVLNANSRPSLPIEPMSDFTLLNGNNEEIESCNSSRNEYTEEACTSNSTQQYENTNNPLSSIKQSSIQVLENKIQVCLQELQSTTSHDNARRSIDLCDMIKAASEAISALHKIP